MKQPQKFHKLTDLMALLVFAVFAVCILLVLLTGADVYRNLADSGQAQYNRRTAARYITTRVRQADTAGAVSVEDFEGEDALVLRETVNGRTYLTRVYCYGGFLRELFTAEDGSFSPEDGEKLLEAESFSVTREGRLLHAQITLPEGSTQSLTLFLRTGEGAAS